MAFDYQLLAAARMQDYERIAVRADLVRRARRSQALPLAADSPNPDARSSISQTRAA